MKAFLIVGGFILFGAILGLVKWHVYHLLNSL